MKSSTSYIGLDVHKSTISVAVADEGRGGEVRNYGVVENRADLLIKLAERLSRGQRLHFCYEAGPCGYGLHRLLCGLGHDCTGPDYGGERMLTGRAGDGRPPKRGSTPAGTTRVASSFDHASRLHVGLASANPEGVSGSIRRARENSGGSLGCSSVSPRWVVHLLR